MVLLSAHNKKETTFHMIDSPVIKQDLRPYLGASGLGHKCERYLWYTFRWCYKSEISSRLNRLFTRGHLEEPKIIAELNKIGIITYGDQKGFTAGHGHIKGHCDGFALRVPEAPKTEHLLEFKTVASKSFAKLKKDGLKLYSDNYWAQVHIYMGEFKVTRCLHISVNKDNDDMYIERIYYDEKFHKELMKKGNRILFSECPPEKRFSPTWYECRWCNAKDICHGKGKIHKTCRTCAHCSMLNEGKWGCILHDLTLATDQQRLACNKYEKMDM